MISDVRLAVLRLVRRPLGSALIVLVMAAGVGLSATVFSTAWGLLWRGLDVDGELVRLAVDDDRDFKSLPWDVFVALRDGCRSCDGLGAWLPVAVDVGELDLHPERLNGAQVSAGTLELLGVEPLMGRFFTREEEQTGAPVVVVGERLWRQQLGGSAEALGRQITVYRQKVTVVGVVAEGVRAPYNQELWIPITERSVRASPWMQAFARLADGATAAGIREELGGVLIALGKADPVGVDQVGIGQYKSSQGKNDRGGETSPALVESFEQAYHDETLVRSLRLSLVAAALVLLVACANAASLLMARGLERRRELAVRRALGADRAKLLRLQMMEVAVLALVSGGLGFALAHLGVRLFRSMGPVQGPYWMDVRLDVAAVAFVTLVTLIVALAAGLLPAWLGSRMASLRAGRGATISQTWLRRLVVAQVALGTAIGAGAWWLVGATDRLGEPLETLRRDDVVVLQSSTFGSEHAASKEASEVYWRRVLSELENLPQVDSAAIAPIPGSFDGRASVKVDENEAISVTRRLVSPGALEILDLPLLAGRDFRAEEMSSAEVVMIDAYLAERLFGGDALGRRLTVGDQKKRVIAVVPELTAPDAARGAVYLPAFGERRTAYFVALQINGGQSTRSSSETVSGDVPPALESEVRGALTQVDPLAAVYWVKTMRHWMDHQLRHAERLSTVFSIFAAVTLLLAALGLYGLLALFVTGRRRVLAIRQALGARPSTLRGHVFSHAMARVSLGVMLGSGLALWLLAALRGLFGAGAPMTVLAQTAATLLMLGLLAAWLPARQAARADASGLRQD